MIRKACVALAALAAGLLVAGAASAQYRGYGYSYDAAPDYYYGRQLEGGPYGYGPGPYGPPPGYGPDEGPYGAPDRRGEAAPYADPREDDRRAYAPRNDRQREAAPERDLPYADPLNGNPDADDQGPDAGGPAHKASDADLGDNSHRTTRTEVDNKTNQPPGTIVIDTGSRHLFYTEPGGRALQYGIGVGREGFAWKGIAHVERKSEWPDWFPPSDMLKRRPDLPTHMAGGIENPLGARALYLFQGKKDTMFRIHGTNEPDTIGKAVSSGCIRMMNADVIDLYGRVPVGTKVVVL